MAAIQFSRVIPTYGVLLYAMIMQLTQDVKTATAKFRLYNAKRREGMCVIFQEYVLSLNALAKTHNCAGTAGDSGVCISVRNGFTIEICWFTHSLRTFLSHSAHGAIAHAMEDSELMDRR